MIGRDYEVPAWVARRVGPLVQAAKAGGEAAIVTALRLRLLDLEPNEKREVF